MSNPELYRFGPDRQPARKPNTVFVFADDLGYGDLGSYEEAPRKTPRSEEPGIGCGGRIRTALSGGVCGADGDGDCCVAG